MYVGPKYDCARVFEIASTNAKKNIVSLKLCMKRRGYNYVCSTTVHGVTQVYSCSISFCHVWSGIPELNKDRWRVWAGGQVSLQCGEIFMGTGLVQAQAGERELTTVPLDLTRVRSDLHKCITS